MSPDDLFNDLAVHSAARKGHTNIVCLLLEADQFRDRDSITYFTEESLVHIAVKTGNRKLFDELVIMGAKVGLADASGTRAHQLTSDREWKKCIIELTDEEEKRNKMARDDESFRKVHMKMIEDKEMKEKQLMRALLEQGEEENGASTKLAQAGKKKNKKKKNETRRKVDTSSKTSTSESIMLDLSVGLSHLQLENTTSEANDIATEKPLVVGDASVEKVEVASKGPNADHATPSDDEPPHNSASDVKFV